VTPTKRPVRPWRAAAYLPNPAGRPVSGGRTSAATLAGLSHFITDRQAAGWTVKVWKVLPLREEEGGQS
jgi:hypothetical protein